MTFKERFDDFFEPDLPPRFRWLPLVLGIVIGGAGASFSLLSWSYGFVGSIGGFFWGMVWGMRLQDEHRMEQERIQKLRDEWRGRSR